MMRKASGWSMAATVAVMMAAGAMALGDDSFPLLPKTRKPAVLGALPDGPKFIEGRPKPAAGENVADPETLLTPPDDTFELQRRNNFYKKDKSGGLYRWAASGHWSNYDESKTGDWQKTVPDPLKMLDGTMVKTAEEWRTKRRPEIIKLYETYIFGKAPSNTPKVVWTGADPVDNGDGTITRTATGKFVNADGSDFVNPAAPGRGGRGAPAAGPGAMGDSSDPMFFVAAPAGPAADGAPAAPGGGARRGGRAGAAGGRGAPGGGRGGGGGGLTVTYTIPKDAAGPVPLVQGNGGRALGFGNVTFGGQAPNVRSNPPSPDDWGAIRKFGWVISQGINFLETDPRVDAHQIAIQGASIGGKQALVAGVFDERINMVAAFVSGEMGAAMSRHDWGETIDDVAQLSAGNYCENFQYWVGHFDENPVDAHYLVALMAGRHLLVTGGTTDQWSDPLGVFWSCHYASPVWKLLGQKGIDEAAMPAPDVFIGDELVFYDHEGGHAVLGPETAKYQEMIKKFFKIKAAAK